MLKNLLPKLIQRDKQNQNPNPEQEPENLSPNLLSSFDEEFQIIYKTTRESIKFLKVFIVILPAIFLITLIYNQALSLRISKINSSIRELNDDILFYKPTMEEVNNITEKINLYKNVTTQRVSVSDLLQKIISVTPSDISLTSLKYDGDKVSIQLSSPSALKISLAIYNYFQTGTVSEIVLKSTSLDTNANGYLAEMDLILKK